MNKERETLSAEFELPQTSIEMAAAFLNNYMAFTGTWAVNEAMMYSGKNGEKPSIHEVKTGTLVLVGLKPQLQQMAGMCEDVLGRDITEEDMNRLQHKMYTLFREDAQEHFSIPDEIPAHLREEAEEPSGPDVELREYPA